MPRERPGRSAPTCIRQRSARRWDTAGETGSVTGRVQDFRPDGSVVPQVVTGVWRKRGRRQWEVKAINIAADGQCLFFVEAWDLAARSLSGTIYALD